MFRRLANRIVQKFITRLFSEPYGKNLWEGVISVQRSGLINIVENDLRAAECGILQKPIGTHRQFPQFDGLLFIPAQLYQHPVDDLVEINLATVLGKCARRPMHISMPIMLSAMGYGVAVSKSVSRALTKGAAFAGTAFNTGQGPALPMHRDLSHKLVVQYYDAIWAPDESMLRQADMIEIRIGQGASAGSGFTIPRTSLTDEILRDMGLPPNPSDRDLHISAGLPGIHLVDDLKRLVDHLRGVSQGAPIAVKLAAGHHLELDIKIAIEAGVDVLVLDGAQGGDHSSPAILVDDFGLPTLTALCRAVRFITENRLRDRVDLVISGGLRTPGDILKALALGADAVNIGTAALFAMTYTQIAKTLPFEPPTELTWADGSMREQFDEEFGAMSLGNFLKSCAEELKVGIRALGKTSIAALAPTDLVAWDPSAARITGLPLI